MIRLRERQVLHKIMHYSLGGIETMTKGSRLREKFIFSLSHSVCGSADGKVMMGWECYFGRVTVEYVFSV
jgi:hypothetical protein